MGSALVGGESRRYRARRSAQVGSEHRVRLDAARRRGQLRRATGGSGGAICGGAGKAQGEDENEEAEEHGGASARGPTGESGCTGRATRQDPERAPP